jgi:peptidoglycan/LPS O-acetylase OafA/YrhL
MSGTAPNAAPDRLTYRPEIDGLRAIAVLAVIVNHAAAGLLPGGFLGVDLFFVISGYLITGILLGDLEAGRFSIARFYERRARRIIPPLMLVMLLCIPFAVVLDLPDDLENFGQSLIATTFFANNILLLLTSGYFQLEAAFKPLLHTWSLGVEEQYYLLVPLLMWGAWRLGKARGVAIGIAAIGAASFLFCLWASRAAPWFNFFMILSRGWELGAGALIVFAEPKLRPLAGKWGAALAAAGLVLAIAPLCLHASPSGPGLLTLAPVAGVCLVLAFGGASDPVGRFLTLPPLTGIGLVSYSAYLFHQPVYAFVRLASLEEPRPTLMLALIGPILLLAWLSWRFVERPFRDRARIGTRTLLIVCGTASLIAAGTGAVFYLTSGFYRNWPQLAGPGAGDGPGVNIAYNMAPERFRDVALPETRERVRVLVIGTSFGRDFINMGLETGSLDPQALSIEEFPDCYQLTPAALQNAARADFIVLATRFEARKLLCVIRRMRELRGVTSIPITVIGRKSFGWNNNAVMLLPRQARMTWRVKPTEEAIAANEAAKRALPPSVYVDVLGMIGDDRGRVPVFTPDEKFISEDREHLTRAGARYLGPILFRHPALAAITAAVRAKAAPAKP